jgi:formate dehydrogenase subunit gamma
MSAIDPSVGIDAVAVKARTADDVIVQDEIIRHRLSTRVIHWSVAITFFLSLATGLPIWTPVFGWMAAFFGGLSVCRILHPYVSLAFFVAIGFMFFHWIGDMRMTREERSWLGPDLMVRMREHLAQTGRYNAGQKMFFFTSMLGALGLLVTGIVLSWPETFLPIVRELSILLHDLAFILFTVSIVLHVYLSTVSEPGTFKAMTRGTVSRAWARIHHPRWYSELMGEKTERR